VKMKQQPDLRKEVTPFFDAVKSMLTNRVKEGKPAIAPLYMFATLTLYAQAKLEQPAQVCLVPEWATEEAKAQCFASFVMFLNKFCESAILCGSGRGEHSNFGEGEVMYVFATNYMPGYEPWTLAQLYTVVESEVIFDVECCSSDGNVKFFDLPGLWPEGVGPV
jgi:hypothetical protein